MKSFCSPIATPCENFRSCETTPWHTSAISQPMPPFCSCESLCEITQAFRISILQPYPFISQLRNGLRKWPLIVKLATKMALCCENAHPLRKVQPSLGFQFKRFKFQIFILNPSFALRKTFLWCEIGAKSEHHFQRTPI